MQEHRCTLATSLPQNGVGGLEALAIHWSIKLVGLDLERQHFPPCTPPRILKQIVENTWQGPLHFKRLTWSVGPIPFHSTPPQI